MSPAIATFCETSQERDIVDAILNQSYADNNAMDALINGLETGNALIPEPDFYHALAVWFGGYQNQDLSRKKQGLQLLRKVIQLAESKYATDLPENNLIIGIIKAYTARAFFENEQIIKGYYIGIDAVARLDQFLESATSESKGYHDAKFLLALYSVYTHDLKTRSHWLLGTINSVGDKAQSIRDIHGAIQSNAAFASEAARAFLAEVNWRTPNICSYRTLARSTAKSLPNNLDLALLAQGVLLKCGEPDLALEINNRFHTRTDLPSIVKQKLSKARLRIYADLGAVSDIQQLDLPDALTSYGFLALANALDLSSDRSEAKKQYQMLLDSDAVSAAIKRAAKVRMTYPYRQPKVIPATENHQQLQVCQHQ